MQHCKVRGEDLLVNFSIKNSLQILDSTERYNFSLHCVIPQVNLHGKLSAKGGHGGKTSNYSDYCGDGGGGGLIHIRSFDSYFSDSSVFDLKGGRGLEDGKDGIFRSVGE